MDLITQLITVFTMLIIFVSGFIVGFISVFILLFARMRSDSDFPPSGKPIDKSNLSNAFKLLAVVFLHPSWLLYMYYSDGKRPFIWMVRDEFTDTLDMKPPELK